MLGQRGHEVRVLQLHSTLQLRMPQASVPIHPLHITHAGQFNQLSQLRLTSPRCTSSKRCTRLCWHTRHSSLPHRSAAGQAESAALAMLGTLFSTSGAVLAAATPHSQLWQCKGSKGRHTWNATASKEPRVPRLHTEPVGMNKSL